MTRLQRGLATALVVALGGTAGFVSYRLTPSETAPVPRTDRAQPPEDGAGVPATPVPDTLPDLSLPDLSGRPRSLRSFGARPLIVNFWATWCEPCRKEIPLLRELRERYRSDNLEIVGIALDFGQSVSEYLHHTPIDYPLLIGQEGGLAAAQSFGMGMALPFSVFVDAAGNIVALKVGELHRDEADFILGEVRALDAGSAALPDARKRIQDGLRDLSVRRARAQHNPG